MFKPDSTFKKLAKDYQNCAYVHRDGIVLWEKRAIKSSKYSAEVNVYHVWPCEIRMQASRYGIKEYCSVADTVQRLVVHNPSELLSGLESVEVYYNNASESMRDKGLACTSVYLTAPNGMRWSHDIFTFLSSNITVQDSMPGSVNDWHADYDEYIEIHK